MGASHHSPANVKFQVTPLRQTSLEKDQLFTADTQICKSRVVISKEKNCGVP